MDSMLRDNCQTMLGVKSSADLFSALQRFSCDLGFTLFSASAVIDHFVGDPASFATIDNAPSGYQEAYLDAALARRDPVMQHCKTTGVPLVWDRSTYVKAGQLPLWEQMAPYGYQCGLSTSMHLPRGRHFVLGVERDQPLPADAIEKTRIVSAIVMFAVYAHDSFMNILLADVPGGERPELTARELETLRWTLDGKTAWEVGRILGIAENTVIRHAQQAMHKLDCSSKHHAAVKALRLGLIQ